jgi:hypothetical protein
MYVQLHRFISLNMMTLMSGDNSFWKGMVFLPSRHRFRICLEIRRGNQEDGNLAEILTGYRRIYSVALLICLNAKKISYFKRWVECDRGLN